jgi:hypothetical protein
MLFLDTSEIRDGLAVYWLIDEITNKRVCGICFENGILSIHNQGIAEFIAFMVSSEDEWMAAAREAGGEDE